MTTASVIIVLIAILIVGAIAWNTFGGRSDLGRRRRDRHRDTPRAQVAENGVRGSALAQAD